MPSSQLLNKFKPSLLFSGEREEKYPYGINSEERFLTILRRESARADRNGHGFSVVALDPIDGDIKSAATGHMAHYLVDQLRATDEIGWFEGKRIGVLLYNTPVEGAWRFVEKVRNNSQGAFIDPKVDIYTYPSGWGMEEGKDAGTNRMESHVDANDQRVALESIAVRQTQAARDIRSLCVNGLPAWKRAIDVLGAGIGLLLISPLLLAVAAFIKIVSPGPVFFKQERVGYLGKRFLLWKFRTMHVNNDASAHKEYLANLIAGDAEEKPMTKNDNDPRIIRFGNVLRKSCIDELPQLINVLLGEMSLVGPRPPIPYEADEYLRWHTGRFDATPGMTGLWQVSGKNRLTFTQMARLDIRYSQRLSPLLDALILLKTPAVVVGQALENKFRPQALRKRAIKNA